MPRDVTVVRALDQLHLITGGVRHLIPEEHRTTVLLALGLETTPPHEVPANWLALFTQGSPMAPLSVPDAGAPTSGMPVALEQAVVGSVVEVDDDGASRRYVITGAGTAAPLTPVAAKLYPAETPLSASIKDMASLDVDPAGIAPADWPGQIQNPVPTDSVPCASLGRDTAGRPVTVLESMERNTLAAALPGTAEPEQKLQASHDVATVLGGSGALVRADDGGTLGQVLFVSDLGLLHGLGNDPSESLKRLGYEQARIVALPVAWTQLVPASTTLDPDAAWTTVGQR